jgi:hypothetical protein
MGLGIKKNLKRLLGISTGKNKGPAQPSRLQIWSIGIYEGDSPYTLASPAGVSNPVLTCADVTDIDALLVADPFMIRRDGIWHMFFEVLNKASKLGEIGHATSVDGIEWVYQKIVIREPFHLSYPYLYEWQNEIYMMPESWRGGGIRLYKATDFPNDWHCIGTVMQGGRFADSSLFRHDDRWWLLTEAAEKVQSPILRLFTSDALLGPWHEHPMSPVMDSNPHLARPCGRVIKVGNHFTRFAQDVYPVYGSRVYAFEIQELTASTYKESLVSKQPILEAGTAHWNNGGMHHIDAHRLHDGRWRACVDGFKWVTPPARHL